MLTLLQCCVTYAWQGFQQPAWFGACSRRAFTDRRSVVIEMLHETMTAAFLSICKAGLMLNECFSFVGRLLKSCVPFTGILRIAYGAFAKTLQV